MTGMIILVNLGHDKNVFTYKTIFQFADGRHIYFMLLGHDKTRNATKIIIVYGIHIEHATLDVVH